MTDSDMFGARAVSGEFMGYMKDGSPVHAVALEDDAVSTITPIMVAASGIALGWLVMGAVVDFFVRNPSR